MHFDATPLTSEALDQLARKRTRAKIGWIIHACVYACVNLWLVALSAYHGKAWALFPVLGWGLGLFLHGLSVWLVQSGSHWYMQMVKRERAALERQQARP